MNRNEKKEVQKQLLKEAAVELIHENGAKINVKRICEKAGIKRTNFYTHYHYMKDLIDDIITDDSYENRLLFQKEDLEGFAPSSFVSMLKNIKNERNIFNTMTKDLKYYYTAPNSESFFSEIIRNLCINKGITEETEQQCQLLYFRSGVQSIIQYWVSKDFSISEENLSEMIYNCISEKLKR